jgi:ribose 5-phosphate isomerase A
MKHAVARKILDFIPVHDVIGVGTGSTVDLVIEELGKKACAEKISVSVVATSLETAWKCELAGLRVLDSSYSGEISFCFDGADEVNEHLWLIKGKGGAMLREKILAAKSREYVIVADETKLVAKLGQNHSIPIEVIPEALGSVKRSLSSIGAIDLTVRQAVNKHGPVITEYGNVIVEAKFSAITASLEKEIKNIVGVLESGLFISQATKVLIGYKTGEVRLFTR